MEKKSYDVVVIGGGPAGYPAAIRLAQNGLKCCLVTTKGDLGGTCLNRGCIPSKSLIHGASIVKSIKNASKYGIKVDGLSYNYKEMVGHKDKTVSSVRGNLTSLLTANGVDVIEGFASFLSNSECKVEGETSYHLTFKNSIIATGSEPKEVPAFPFDQKKIIDSTTLLQLEKLPKSLAIIGGGYIGCEFASLFNTFDVPVTIIEMMPSILPNEEEKISQTLSKSFEKRGIQILRDKVVESINYEKEMCVLHLKGGEKIKADYALVAIGRKLNTDNIGLEKIGVRLTDDGLIDVDEHMETTCKGIYAVGDIASKYWLAHVGTHQGLVAAERISGKDVSMDYQAVPSVIFTDPEIATVGLTLKKAIEQGYNATIGTFPFQALGKSQADLQTEGFAQVIIDKDTGEILGSQVIGYQASTLIAEMALAIQNELTIHSITETIHAHPTLTEVWMEAAFMADEKPLHLPKKTQRANH